MDTEFAVVFPGDGADAVQESAAVAAFARLDELELLLTRFNDTSDIAVIGALSPGETVRVARETVEVLEVCARVCAATAGAFDPTVAHRNFSDLAIDRDNLLVAVKRRGVQLDFGGVGKGYALDEMARILRSEQYAQENWLLDAGTSTILVSGGPWPLGVGGAWKSRTRIETVLKMSSGALSGSGFEIQGAHITDPRTGEAASRWVQSWVRAPSGAVADALSTAALSLSSRELDAAAAEFGASILVARKQSRFADRFRDPLKWHPSPPD